MDFLYQEQFEAMHKDGHLTRLDTAFSRDQQKKIYVQDRIEENAAEVYAWLERGARTSISAGMLPVWRRMCTRRCWMRLRRGPMDAAARGGVPGADEEG